jgi:hypothetical protein
MPAFVTPAAVVQVFLASGYTYVCVCHCVSLCVNSRGTPFHEVWDIYNK